MTTFNTGRRKTFDRYGRILEELRERIVTGKDPVGSRLPPRRELAEHYDTTLVTVQKALLRLERMGFIESRGWEGSFVAEHPPHLYRYGLLMPELPTGPDGWHWSKFWSTLNRVAHETARWAPRSVVSYCGLENWSESEDAHRLVADVSEGCLAGLLLIGPQLLSDSPVEGLLRQHPLPMVSYSSKPAGPGIPRVMSDPELPARAIAHLKSQGCKRVAVIGFQFDLGAKPENGIWHDLLHQSGFPYWPGAVMGFDPHFPFPAGIWAHHLLTLPPGYRPDGILVTDDNFVDMVAQGIHAAGAEIGRDVKVLANCNYPLKSPIPAGIDRIGCDLAEVLKVGMELLEQQRQGSVVPAFRTIKAQLDVSA